MKNVLFFQINIISDDQIKLKKVYRIGVKFLIKLLIFTSIIIYSIKNLVEMENRILFAFALNICAGLSTCIGGLLIYFKRFVYLANPTCLGVSLGMSAGVMIFISLVEIFHESINNFKEGISGSKKDEDCNEICQGNAWLFSSLCFLGGSLLVYLLDFIVHRLSPQSETKTDIIIQELSVLQNSHRNVNESHPEEQQTEIPLSQLSEKEQKIKLTTDAKTQLNRTGILTALAIAIHNFPEGIATFIGARKDTRLGLTLAIGIALHNIPEGVAVATPVYFATGSRCKALLWTFISALAEPLGGLLSYLILGDELGKNLEGVIFGLITGVMVTISFKELIPTAHRYCSHQNRVTFSILIGISIMAISLILFAYAGI